MAGKAGSPPTRPFLNSRKCPSRSAAMVYWRQLCDAIATKTVCGGEPGMARIHIQLGRVKRAAPIVRAITPSQSTQLLGWSVRPQGVHTERFSANLCMAWRGQQMSQPQHRGETLPDASFVQFLQAYEEAVRQLIRFVHYWKDRPKDKRGDHHRKPPTMAFPWGQEDVKR